MITNGQTISTGLFVRALKRLNPALRVCSFEGSDKLAGLYLINKQGEWEDICGVDKQSVPAYATFDDGGHVVRAGWRRTLWILLQHGYTTKEKIRLVCRGFFDYRACGADRFVGGIAGDPIDNKFQKFMLQMADRPEDEQELSPEQILELGTDVQAKDTQAQKEDREHDKWFLETWKKTGVKPNY
jgi:hypothetical protein